MLTQKKYKDILDEIRRLAAGFTPEWRFDTEKPDAGAALASAWAKLIEGTLERLEGTAERAAVELLRGLGTENQPPEFARGFLCFQIQPGLEERILIPPGTHVGVPGDPDTALVTETPLYAGAAKLRAVCQASRSPDSVRRDEPAENLRLFEFTKKNERVWSFEHSGALDISQGGTLGVNINFTQNEKAFLEALTNLECVLWEYLSPDGYKPVQEVTSSEGRLFLGCGKESFGGLVRLSLLRSADFDGARFFRLRFYPKNERLRPDAVYSGELLQTETGFFPFGGSFSLYDTFCVSCGEAFNKPDSTVELSLTLRAIKVPIEGYPRPEQIWKPILRPEEIIRIDEKEIKITAVSWEYFNGTGWMALSVYDDARDFFTVGAEPERRKLRFICPHDMRPITIGAHETCFIRARILAAENLFAMYGFYISPWLEELEISYFSEDGYEPERTISRQSLDTLEYERIREPVPLIDSRFEEPAVYFEFDSPFSKGALLLEMEDMDSAVPPIFLEYYSDGGWRAMEHSSADGLFSRTALVDYKVAQPPEKLGIFGVEAYWMRAADRTGAFTSLEKKPVLRRAYENVARATAANPGASSNLDRRCFTVPADSLKGIAEAFNPLPTSGGRDIEPDERTLIRGIRAFGHGGRAVSCRDIENLALTVSRDIIKCRCVPDSDFQTQDNVSGIRLAIFTRELFSYEFEALSVLVRENVLPLMPLGSGGLYITEPRFVSVGVRACVVRSGGEAGISDIALSIERFLDPQNGNFDNTGWEFGSLPSLAHISAMLRQLSGVARISELNVTYCAEYGAEEYGRLQEDPFVLPKNGAHEITVKNDA